MTTKKPKKKINLKKDNPKLYRARALKLALHKLGQTLSTDQILQWMESSQICPYCHKHIDPLDYSIDHMLPKNRGGSNDLSNLQLIDLKCNKVKGDITDEEFKQLMEFLKDKPIIYENLYKRLRMAGFGFVYKKKKVD